MSAADFQQPWLKQNSQLVVLCIFIFGFSFIAFDPFVSHQFCRVIAIKYEITNEVHKFCRLHVNCLRRLSNIRHHQLGDCLYDCHIQHVESIKSMAAGQQLYGMVRF